VIRQGRLVSAALAVSVMGACASLGAHQQAKAAKPLTEEDRLAVLRRSQVWARTDVPAMDMKAGPQGPGAFAPGETVTCDYVDRKLGGNTPKFACAIAPEDEIKVKFGLHNGEVYGEVAATRLLWALGFGADRMYPVRVVCRGCPSKLGGAPGESRREMVFDPAAVERKAPGKTIETRPEEGWSWKELDLVDEAAGGAPQAHRDALKLLAVLMQHGDNKSQQQRLSCLDKEKEKDGEIEPHGELRCEHPFMLINDLGLTFGRVDILNRDQLESVNFKRWSETSIWEKDPGCVGNLPKSLTGTLHDPVIGEPGRQFLADLLSQLSDNQLHDLFEVSRFALRTPSKPADAPVGVTVDDWVGAFKQKREAIAARHCS
jgi:hypothetical protein